MQEAVREAMREQFGGFGSHCYDGRHLAYRPADTNLASQGQVRNTHIAMQIDKDCSLE